MIIYLISNHLSTAAGITCYAVHPGGVKTNLGTHLEGFWGCLLCCIKPCFKTAESGAKVCMQPT